MERAFHCANSESCSLDNAKVCLDDMIYIQSGCVSGALLGSDVCEDVDTTYELVSNLRVKIDQETQELGCCSNLEMAGGVWLGDDKIWLWGEQNTAVIGEQAGWCVDGGHKRWCRMKNLPGQRVLVERGHRTGD
jgi:hypothetical protein